MSRLGRDKPAIASLLAFPRSQGDAANSSADHFELQVQAAIDATPWRPPVPLARLRGRPLRLGGQDITDLDAVAARGDVLIAVSCKGVVYSTDYDAGNFKTVRNAASTVTDGMVEWRDRMDRLRANPKGDNYDFTGKTIVGVVCTPLPVFIP